MLPIYLVKSNRDPSCTHDLKCLVRSPLFWVAMRDRSEPLPAEAAASDSGADPDPGSYGDRAQRRTENVQNVRIAIEALTGDTLEQLHATDP